MKSWEKERLQKEYTTKIKFILYWPLKIFGFNRFDIKDGQFIKKSASSIFFSFIVLFMIDFSALYILYKIAYEIKFMFITEVIIVLEFSVFHTCVLLNMSLVNRESCARFLRKGLEIDDFIGVKSTKFLRDIVANTYLMLSAAVAMSEIIVLVILLFTYKVPSSVVMTGATFFLLLYFIYYDLSFFVTLYLFLTLRVHYLNVALIKVAKVNPDVFPNQYPLHPFFWNKKLDKLVDFHNQGDLEKFTRAYKMVFELLRHLENCYRFTIFCCLAYLTLGTFVNVQAFIMYIKSEVDSIRVAALTGWCFLSWAFQITISKQSDMFCGQISQTNLICTYIQLDPDCPGEIYEITRSIISTLRVRDPRLSVYDLFIFDSSLLLRIASSLIVYILMQLQLNFPGRVEYFDNSETTTEVM